MTQQSPPPPLASVQTLSKQPLSTMYAKVRLSIKVVNIGIVLSLLGILFIQPWITLDTRVITLLPIVAIIIATAGCVFSLLGWLSDRTKYYAVREHDIHFGGGLWVKRLTSQPFGRVQHVEVSQGPIERLAGLSKLHVYSAGSGFQSFIIPGLPEQAAQTLRQLISDKASIASKAEAEASGHSQ
ncbi:PH domain-containing protein [Alteromonas facilis]|uniref:PH domain-containing protein n=1 Tax=Alteromonas facilis TaxID=2048004 RepID=UPI000C28FBFC|nr:PH domain-containing protein [Alteromonas facilis]